MDNKEYTIDTETRKKGQHLDIVERGEIKGLHKQGFSVRAIAESIGGFTALRCGVAMIMLQNSCRKRKAPQHSL